MLILFLLSFLRWRQNLNVTFKKCFKFIKILRFYFLIKILILNIKTYKFIHVLMWRRFFYHHSRISKYKGDLYYQFHIFISQVELNFWIWIIFKVYTWKLENQPKPCLCHGHGYFLLGPILSYLISWTLNTI